MMRRLTKRAGNWFWVAREWLVGEPELHVLGVLLDRSGVFVDAGANTGVYSLSAGRFAGRVAAFEPNPDLAAHLRVVLRGQDEVYEAAVSDRTSTEMFSVPGGEGIGQHTRGSLRGVADDADREEPSADGTRTFPVRTCVLDDESLGSVQVVKIDVEGHENAVLRGAKRTLSTHRPVVIVEAEERHSPGTIEEVRSLFEALDYDGWFLHRGRVVPFDQFDAAVHQAPGDGPGYGQRAGSDYVNNFIWVPREREHVVPALRRAAERGRLRSIIGMALGRR